MLGLPAHLIAKIEGGQDDEDPGFGVWPENWDTVAAFGQICGQWNVVGLSTMAGAKLHYIGLDYSGVRSGLLNAGIEITPELWDGIRTMEAAMRRALNK